MDHESRRSLQRSCSTVQGLKVQSQIRRACSSRSTARLSSNRVQKQSVEVWLDRMRDRHIVSVQAAQPGPAPPGQSQRAKRMLGAGTKRRSERFRAGKQLELLERLKPWNRLFSWNGWDHWNKLLFGLFSDGGPQSAGQRKILFRQSQTILRDLKI